MKPVRVLHVSGGSLDYGGIASWLISYVSRLDRNCIEADFLVHGLERGAREAEAEALGARIVHVPYRRHDPIGNQRGIEEAIGRGYDIVHAHMDGMNAYPLGIAARAGVPVRISHSHNTDFLTANPVKRVIHEYARRRIPDSATHLFACSEAAGRFLYGDAIYGENRVTLVRNAIEPARFSFDAAARASVRGELRIGGRFLIGSVGRFDLRQKNQLFLLDAFTKAKTVRPDLALVLVGDGADRSAIEGKIRDLGLRDDVILAGYREDIPALYSAFDLFALSSRFEGLGIVLIEAQASGLSCVASDAVPRETQVTNCRYLPLDDSNVWAESFASARPNQTRKLPLKSIREAGYDIAAEAKKLQEFYCEAVKGS